MSGPRLGRPKSGETRLKERIGFQDMGERNAVESGFGVGKQKYGLARIMAHLKETAESVIVLQFIVMNLEHRLRVLFYPFYIFVLRRVQNVIRQANYEMM